MSLIQQGRFISIKDIKQRKVFFFLCDEENLEQHQEQVMDFLQKATRLNIRFKIEKEKIKQGLGFLVFHKVFN